MVDIVRVNLQKGIKRFPLFTVKDQLSFLLTSADMEGKPPTEQHEILDEILDDLYPGHSRTEQEHIFTKVYCAYFGKNAVKISIRSPEGTAEAFMVINDYQLQNEYELDDNIKLGFVYPHTRQKDEKLFLDCLSYIIKDETRYEWADLHEDTKNNILDLVDMEDMENVVLMLTKSCHITVRDNTFGDLLTLFKILFNKSELNEFFKTNYLLNKNNLHIDTMMNSSPMERSIYIALLGDDLKQRKKDA